MVLTETILLYYYSILHCKNKRTIRNMRNEILVEGAETLQPVVKSQKQFLDVQHVEDTRTEKVYLMCKSEINTRCHYC